jgi:hypothetical protein
MDIIKCGLCASSFDVDALVGVDKSGMFNCPFCNHSGLHTHLMNVVQEVIAAAKAPIAAVLEATTASSEALAEVEIKIEEEPVVEEKQPVTPKRKAKQQVVEEAPLSEEEPA